MRKVILDIETDGLKPKKVWVVVTKDLDTKEVLTLRNPTHETLKEFLGGVTHIIGHNIIAFDVPVLDRLLGFDSASVRLTDTLVLSRLCNPSLEGGHSLREWGIRLNLHKGDYDDWSKLTDEMVDYCVQDVEVTYAVYNRLTAKLAPFGDESIDLEHDVQRVITKQINNGWLLDQKQAIDLLGTLYDKKLELENSVRDTFKPLPVFIKEIVPKYKKDGGLSNVGLKFLGDDCSLVGGSFSRIDYPDFNLGSRQQIGKYLQWFGWKPKDFTETGQPIVDEKVLSNVKDIPEAQLIGEYLLVQKRIAQVESWVDARRGRWACTWLC
jgi:DNA polymerase I